MAKQNIPNNIRAVMKAKDLKLDQLAERSGISAAYISRMASGKRNLSMQNLQKLADAMNVKPSDLIENREATDIPIVTWVSAGQFARDDGQQEVIGEIEMPGLDPKGQWIALRVEGDSMDRISPPGSLIFVNILDKTLVPNACYLIEDADSNITYKRFRPNPPRFDPVSNNDKHETISPDTQPVIIGRVRRSLIDM